MLERPDLSDARIRAELHYSYRLPVTGLGFLPIGNDSNAWVFRVQTEADQDYFLKVRRGTIHEASLAVPRYLKDEGIEPIVAPLPSATGRLWHKLDDYALILYPYVDGRVVMTTGMADSHWIELGAVLKRIHTIPLVPELSRQVKAETFSPKWLDFVRELQTQGLPGNPRLDPFVQELTLFWQERRDEIGHILARTDALRHKLLDNPPAAVLCHADIHTANLLLDEQDRIHIVDWDETALAPKERDLMFVMGTGIGFSVGPQEEALFFQGYGERAIDPDALAFYRYGWVVEEIGDYSARILGILSGGGETKQAALGYLRWGFEPGAIVEAAYLADPANH